ncbi:hypothetical protein V1292_006121 [Bradyrhizobium sp. AZCC 1719]|uniref:hypothetical protein n=1 Tax=Bradyrhizobium sp. AZCC 1719 TaxID=3117028 RepID=UPI002FF1161B
MVATFGPNLGSRQESAQILPNIPLTILQLSFGGVKGNLDRESRREGRGNTPTAMMLRSITAEPKQRAGAKLKNSVGFRY